MTAAPLAPARRRFVALLYGLGCHGSFLCAVALAFLGLQDGLTGGRGTLEGGVALAANAALLLQFPLAHSLLLSRRGRSLLARLAPRAVGSDLAPTTFAWIAALQLGLTFACWSPSHVVWWRPEGAAHSWLLAAYLGAWLFLGKALHDGGLGVQTGWIGWSAVWRGRRAQFPPLARSGLFARCRQPIYLGFALTLWTGPVWTPDRLALAVLWSAYCLLGPLHKEQRYQRLHGAAFAEYRRQVPYMLPRMRRTA